MDTVRCVQVSGGHAGRRSALERCDRPADPATTPGICREDDFYEIGGSRWRLAELPKESATSDSSSSASNARAAADNACCGGRCSGSGRRFGSQGAWALVLGDEGRATRTRPGGDEIWREGSSGPIRTATRSTTELFIHGKTKLRPRSMAGFAGARFRHDQSSSAAATGYGRLSCSARRKSRAARRDAVCDADYLGISWTRGIPFRVCDISRTRRARLHEPCEIRSGTADIEHV